MSSANVRQLRPLGAVKPRIETPNPPGKTEGQRVADFAESLGMPLLPWQRHLFDHSLKLDKTGKWRHTETAVVVSRQQGKTHALRMRILAGLFLFGEEQLAGTAQDRQLARETFRLVVEAIEASPELRREVKTIRWANGQEELVLKSGQRYRIVAPTPSAARGYANDFIAIDEAREQEDMSLWAAIRPTINTRRNKTLHGPQVWLTSNAGHAESVLLLDRRRVAFETIQKGKPGPLAWLEWSAPEDASLDDEKAWAYANPSLGTLIDLDTIRQLRNSLDEPVFRTEQLCQFVDTMDAWLPVGAWQDCVSDVLIPDDARGRVIFGVDVSPSWDHATIVALCPVGDRWAVEVVQAWDAGVTEETLIDHLAGLISRWQPHSVAGDNYLLKDMLTKLQRGTGVQVHAIQGADVSRACSTLYQAITSRKIAHPDDDLLNDHVQAAARKEIGESWRLSRRHSARHIDAVMALAAATHSASLMEDADIVIPSR